MYLYSIMNKEFLIGIDECVLIEFVNFSHPVRLLGQWTSEEMDGTLKIDHVQVK